MLTLTTEDNVTFLMSLACLPTVFCHLYFVTCTCILSVTYLSVMDVVSTEMLPTAMSTAGPEIRH